MWASLVHRYHQSVLDFGLRQCTVVAFQHTVCACVHVCVINLGLSLHTLYTVSLSEMWASLVHLYHQSVLDFGLRQCTVVAFQHTVCACVLVCVINLLHTLYTVSLSEMWASLVHLYHQSVLDFGLRQCTVVAFQHTVCACVLVRVINLSLSLPHTVHCQPVWDVGFVGTPVSSVCLRFWASSVYSSSFPAYRLCMCTCMCDKSRLEPPHTVHCQPVWDVGFVGTPVSSVCLRFWASSCV